MPSLAAVVVVLFSTLGVCRAQSGSFVIPSIRAAGGTDFAYWDLFARPAGSTVNVNYLYANPPALLNGEGRDTDTNPTTAFVSRTSLRQTGTSTCFVTSSGAIYSFSEITAFEVPYQPPASTSAEVTNVIFQTLTGGSRLNVESVLLQYKVGSETHSVAPLYRALDDPQTGSFGERIVCGFQWNLTGLGVRDFTIVFAAPDASMPLWEAQLDVVTGSSFVQQLGYLLSTKARPLTRHGRPGYVDKNLPPAVDGRYFFPGETLTLIGQPETDWELTGWLYEGVVHTGFEFPLTFPSHDVTVTALFAPLTYQAWRETMFNHANGLTGSENDYNNDAVSGHLVDHDGDGRSNLAEYAFGGDPYVPDADRTLPQRLTVQVGGQDYPAIRYRTNAAPPGLGDASYRVRVSADQGPWADNSTTPTTTTFSRTLQSDGTELVTERALLPTTSFTTVAFEIAWTADGIQGETLAPGLPVITAPSTLPAGLTGAAYAFALTASGGDAPYSWSVVGGELPAGLVLDSEGMLGGTVTQGGTFVFTVQAIDSNGMAVSKQLQLTIALAPGIATETLPQGITHAPYNFTLAAVGGTVPYTWSIHSGTLPAGFILSADGVLSGLSQAHGTWHFTVKLTDNNRLTDTQALTLTIATSPISITTAAVLGGGVKGLAYSQMLTAAGGTAPYAWTLDSGVLPAGLALNSAGLLTGTPLLNGIYTFTGRLTDAGGIVAVKNFQLMVTDTYQKPVVNAPVFEVATVGVPVAYTVTALNYPKTFTITGLPAGVTARPAGLISGRPSVSGVFLVKIKAANPAGSSAVLTVPMVVRALPNGLVGTFTGIISRDATANGGLGSRLSLTTAVNGFYTAQVTTGALTRRATGWLAASAPHISTTIGTATLSLTLDKDSQLVSGTHGTATVSGWRSTWNASSNPATHRIGYYSAALALADTADIGSPAIPQGHGFATFSVASSGALTVAGKTADNQTITSAGFIGPDGEIAVYTSLYGNQGSVLGQWTLGEEAGGQFAGNSVSGALTWRRPATAGYTYAAGFGPVNVAVAGKYLAPNAKGEVLGLPEAGTADVLFEHGGVDLSATEADVTGFTYTDENKVIVPAAGGVNNAARATLAVNKSTGAVSGTITLVEGSPALKRTVSFYGQTVRLADPEVKAVGWFLLPQIPGQGQTLKTSPVLSGSFLIKQ